MQIHYYTAPCGAGKSYAAAQRIIQNTGRYLIVRDRVEAINDYAAALVRMSLEAGRHLPVTTISALTCKSVRHQVEAIPAQFASLDHVAVIVTHKAMMMSDFSEFEGWHVIIDETPVVLDRQDLKTSQSREFFERNYELNPIHKDWASVTLSQEGWNMTPADLEADDCFKLLRVFHERVTSATPLPDDITARQQRRAHLHDASRRAVVSNLTDWSDMEDGRQWTWWSLWSPKQLAAFASITIMANGFDKSATFAMLKNMNPDVEWIEVPLTAHRTFTPRPVRIRYYAEAHVSSQTLFDSEDGQSYLRQIAAAQRADNQIWMANSRHADHLLQMGGLSLRPHQAGSNSYADFHSATCIYAAKPSAEARAVLKFLDVDPALWTHSYEFEAILQFVCRTSIRNPDSSAAVTLTVYDRQQADYLASYFSAQPHCDVSMELIDLSFAHLERKRGPDAVVMTPDEADAKRAAVKAKRAAAARDRRAKEKLTRVAA